MAKKDIRVCRLQSCDHGKYIDITTDAYVKDGLSFYHPSCFERRTEKPNPTIKTCRYKFCPYDGKIINLGQEKYVKNGNAYYHESCDQRHKEVAKLKTMKCRYKNCPHGGIIDLNSDQYIANGNAYYHESCYHRRSEIKPCGYAGCKYKNMPDINSDDCVVENGKHYHKDCYQIHKDIMLMCDLWSKNISDTVPFALVGKIIKELLSIPAVTSGYLVFMLQYIIDHKLPLRYPQGMRYYVDRQEIKDAYKKKMQPIISQRQFVAKPEDDVAQFTCFTAPKKPAGFGSILGGKK